LRVDLCFDTDCDSFYDRSNHRQLHQAKTMTVTIALGQAQFDLDRFLLAVEAVGGFAGGGVSQNVVEFSVHAVPCRQLLAILRDAIIGEPEKVELTHEQE
jgi:hypothetical protein